MALTAAQIAQFAPLLMIHPEERFYPMDPVEFIRNSRFKHHRGWARDEGYNRNTRSWVGGDNKTADYYDPPVSFVNSFSPWKNNENRRPKDPHCGGHWNVFLQPEGHQIGETDPNGKVPVSYYAKDVDTSSIPEADRKRFRIEVETYTRISYWWFFGYNEAPALSHQGDWEHVTMKVKEGQIVGVWYSAHEPPPRFYPLNELKRDQSGRVIVFCAKGTHASYPQPGKYPLLAGAKDHASAGGYAWDVSGELKNLLSQPWRDYAGAWGEVGETHYSTGPLGPWHKRYTP